MLSLLWVGIASAGSGPWVLSPGDGSVYLGGEAQRIGRLALSDGSYADSVVDVDAGLSKAGAVAEATVGLLPRFEASAQVPWYRVTAHEDGGAVCSALEMGACRTTEGLGIVVLRGKALVVDELAPAPLSLAVGPEVRIGSHQADVRERVTNLGEGTNDLGAFVSLGRSGALGGAYVTGHLDLVGRYRLPNGREGDLAVPAPEGVMDGEWLVGGGHWLLGPTVSVLWRPGGVDFEEANLADVDRFGELSVFSARAGGKLIVRGDTRLAVSLAVLGTAYAVNNPADLISISAGMGWFLSRPTRGDG